MRTVFANAISAAASIGFTVLAVAASAPAAASVDAVPRSVVQTADLDLATAAGHRIAMQRIGRAAAQVCDTASGDRLEGANCRAKVAAEAGQTLDRMTAPQRIAAK